MPSETAEGTMLPEMTSLDPGASTEEISDVRDPLAEMLPGESLVDFLFRKEYYQDGLGSPCFSRVKEDGLLVRLFMTALPELMCVCRFTCGNLRNMTEEQIAIRDPYIKLFLERIEAAWERNKPLRIAEATVYCVVIFCGTVGESLWV